MFEKDFTKPIILEQHDALLSRIDENHSKRPEIERKRGSLNSGYNGEKTLNYFLGLLPPKDYHIFHDIRLPIGKSYFQMDAFLLSPQLSFIIDNKNYSGMVKIDKNQLTQTLNDTEIVYQNPVVQVNRHKILLSNFFGKYQIPLIPIEPLVCFSNTSTAIRISQGYIEAEKRICKAAALLNKIDEMEKHYKKEIVDQKTIGKIKRLLLSKHTANRIAILEKYGINQPDIITGVRCEQCSHIPIDYIHGRWKCPICHFVSKESPFQAIQDYFFIVKPSISNSELREFLHIPTPRAAGHFLSSNTFIASGKNKGRIYFPSK